METIAAISTAPGLGGIGIIRITGDIAFNVLLKIFKSKRVKKIEDIVPNTIIYGKIYEEDRMIDEVLVSFFKSPNSYTREDLVEINTHGGSIVMKEILDLVLRSGAILAQPGEFTKRAFLNGRIDLTKVESIATILNAKSEEELRISGELLQGKLYNKIVNIKEKLMDILMHLEVNIDYPEYDTEEKDKEEILERFNQIFENFFKNNLGEFKPGNIAEKNFSGIGVTVGDAVLTGKIDLIRIDRENKKITVVDYKTGSIPFNIKTNKFNTNSTKIHEYTQQLYFYKILIENAPEFSGYTVEKGVLEFIEPDKHTEKTYNFEVVFKPEEEERLKTLIQAVWAKIKSFDFVLDEEKYSKDIKGTRAFEADLIADFKDSNN